MSLSLLRKAFQRKMTNAWDVIHKLFHSRKAHFPKT
jgi:hypothetical protein